MDNIEQMEREIALLKELLELKEKLREFELAQPDFKIYPYYPVYPEYPTYPTPYKPYGWGTEVTC